MSSKLDVFSYIEYHLFVMKRILNICNFKVILILAIIFIGACFAMSSASANALTLDATAKINAKDGAYLRKSASTSSAQIQLIKDNKTITIKKEVFTNKTSTAKTYKWYYVSYSGKNGYVRSDCVDNIKYTTDKGITTDELNYRVGPDTNYASKGSLKKNTVVTRCLKSYFKGSSQVWYKIKKGSNYYYVSGKYVKVYKETKGTASITVTDLSYPTTVWLKVPFFLRGTITSTQTIEKVRLGIRNSKNKKWVLPSKPAQKDDVNDYTFEISTLDSQIAFASLAKGSYIYRVDVCIGGKWKTNVVKKSFKVKAIPSGKGASVIAEQAIKLAWPNDADYKTKSAFEGGDATEAFKTAFDSVFSTHAGWTNKFTKVGADCGVFVATVIRSCGYDPTFNYYLTGSNSLFNVLPKYPKTWTQVFSYTETEGVTAPVLDQSLFKSGDIIMYHKTSGQHILIYVKVDGKGYMVEAGNTGNESTSYYGRMDEVTDKITDINGRGYKDYYIYRAAK